MGVDESIGVDFLGGGNCLGLEGLQRADTWKYNASLMARTEVLEVPLATFSSDLQLRQQLANTQRDQKRKQQEAATQARRASQGLSGSPAAGASTAPAAKPANDEHCTEHPHVRCEPNEAENRHRHQRSD